MREGVCMNIATNMNEDFKVNQIDNDKILIVYGTVPKVCKTK